MELNLFIAKVPGQPFYRVIVDAIAEAIESGRLAPGQKLPPSRALAIQYQTSYSTVVRAYESLLAKGYLKTHPKEGTYVSSQLAAQDHSSDVGKYRINTHFSSLPEETLSPLARRLLQVPTTDVYRDNDSSAFPAEALLPLGIWNHYLARARHSCLSGSSFYRGKESDFGHAGLRQTLAKYLLRAKGIRCEAAQILITSASGFDLACRLIIEPGDSALIEEPGEMVLRRVLSSHGAQLLRGRVDSHGLVVEALDRLTEQSSRLKIVCVSPTHQSSTGGSMAGASVSGGSMTGGCVTGGSMTGASMTGASMTGGSMPLVRRRQLLEFAERKGCIIWEADSWRQFRYANSPIPSIKSLDASERVIYSGDFSMTMGPLLKLGFLVLPKTLVPLFQRLLDVTGNELSALEQSALQKFIEDGQWERLIQKTRAHYARGGQVVLNCRPQKPEEVSAGPSAGCYERSQTASSIV